MAHDGSGRAATGRLAARLDLGQVLTWTFSLGLVDEVIEVTGAREQRGRLLQARLQG